MNIEKRKIKKHLFVCCNEKESGDCCASRDPKALIKILKKRLRDAGLWDEIKVTKTGCLGPCESGISATLYPDNLLITNIDLNDDEELYKLLTS